MAVPPPTGVQGMPVANTSLTSINFVLKSFSQIYSADQANVFLPLFFYWGLGHVVFYCSVAACGSSLFH